MPPVQAHTDAIVFDEFEEIHIDTIDKEHHDEHHKNDTENEKNSDHHHHCTLLGFSPAITLNESDFKIIVPLQKRKQILFYKDLYTSNFFNGIFQPPQEFNYLVIS